MERDSYIEVGRGSFGIKIGQNPEPISSCTRCRTNRITPEGRRSLYVEERSTEMEPCGSQRYQIDAGCIVP